MPSTLNADNGSVSGSAGLKSSADSSGVLALQTNGTTAVTISTGQVATFAQAPVLPAASIPQAALAVNVAGNGPAFSAYATTAQSLTNSTLTKITFAGENFDTNNNFASSRFTPTVAGYYFVTGSIAMANNSNNIGAYTQIYKNGSSIAMASSTANANMYSAASISTLTYLNGSTDYVEIYGFQISGVTKDTVVTVFNTNDGVTFSGYLARAA